MWCVFEKLKSELTLNVPQDLEYFAYCIGLSNGNYFFTVLLTTLDYFAQLIGLSNGNHFFTVLLITTYVVFKDLWEEVNSITADSDV